MLNNFITLSDFSQMFVSASIMETARGVYRVFIESYQIELVVKKDSAGIWKYLSPFQYCNPHWLEEIVSQLSEPVLKDQ